MKDCRMSLDDIVDFISMEQFDVDVDAVCFGLLRTTISYIRAEKYNFVVFDSMIRSCR